MQRCAFTRAVLLMTMICFARNEMTGGGGHVQPETIRIQQPSEGSEFDNDAQVPIEVWTSSKSDQTSRVEVRIGREHVPFANKTRIDILNSVVSLGGAAPGAYEVDVQRLAANGTVLESSKRTFQLRLNRKDWFNAMKVRQLDGELMDWDTWATEAIAEYLKRGNPEGWMQQVISALAERDGQRLLCTDKCRTLLHLAVRTAEHHMTTSHAYHEGKPLEFRRWDPPRRDDYIQMITQVVSALPKAALDTVDEHGYAALHYVSYTGMYITIRLLLHLGADPNVQSKMTAQERPLHIAVGSNDINLAMELLSYGADPLKTDAWGRTPLMLSSTLDMIQMSKTLVSRGAPCHSEEDADVESEADDAATVADEELLGLLLQDNANALRIAAEAGALGRNPIERIDAPLGRYRTMLSAATESASTAVASYLLDIGAHCEPPRYTAPGVQPTEPQSHTGGWLMNSSTEFLPPRGTEIASVSIDEMDSDRWLRDFHWIRRPVLIKNVVNDTWPAIRRWERNNLMKGFGHEQVITSRVPHGYGTYGYKFKSLQEHIEYMREDNHSLPMYSFDIWLMAKQPELKQHYMVPFDRLTDLTEYGTRSQFITGPRRSGTPMHVHCTAINIAVYGRKRWFLYPPAQSGTDSLHPVEWIESDAYRRRAPIEVLQEAGDLIYVPALWGHAVLNLEETVAFALEFNPGFCQMNHYTKTM